MIRREISFADGSQHWSLISQVDHARLSGQLAANWGNAQVPYVIGDPATEQVIGQQNVRNEVLRAIAHHDDGWRRWEAAPTIDPEHRRPRSFMEMPLEESLRIWRDSILACAEIGPLAAWMVAGHFLELRSSSDSQSPAADAWGEEMHRRRQQWIDHWQQIDPRLHTEPLARRCQAWLRAFDVLSLRLCCGESESFEFPYADESTPAICPPVRLAVEERSDRDQRLTVSVAPWPFASGEWDVEIGGVIVPAGDYHRGTACLESGTRGQHRWRLRPGE